MISPTPLPQPARDPGAILPRSASLAAWLWAGAPDDRSVVAALRILMHDDEPHQLRGHLPAGVAVASLASLFHLWSGRVVAAVALFPGPGDAMGAPAAISAEAIEAEECVLVTVRADEADGVVEHWALAPDIEPFGSALEPGFLVTWDVVAIDAWENRALGTVGALGDAERQLQRGLREATEALMELDVSRWRDAAGETIAALREVVDLRPYLPSDLDPRRSHVLQSAARLRAIVDLATEDDGGAVNLWQADQRSTALREVDRTARRAMSAATLLTPLTP
ncbi:hypothetical protein SAMN05216410_3151 [Sanguibacter gelidistatuariae]|uniref:Uncharacterized protein n=1 Tax=Sanguibacter gelidistatuariae TaxID=1814289 RepID=A0A1G6TPY7_9MICO|nr:hypothetical protein [Sanguibacter gelidistatuariae]SDD30437.1 hypothetical protein SAMN05216410_3151 [Sanguibacter gelidistatuariae]